MFSFRGYLLFFFLNPRSDFCGVCGFCSGLFFFSLAFRLTSPKRQFCQIRFSDGCHWGDRNLEQASGALCESIYVLLWAGVSWVNWGCLQMYCAAGEEIVNWRLLSFLSQRKNDVWLSWILNTVMCRGLILVVLYC